MSRWHITPVAGLAVALACSSPASATAQTVSQEPANGEYLIQYKVDGHDYVARVPSGDRIAPTLEVTGLDVSGPTLRYNYQVSNPTSADAAFNRALFLLSVPCAGVDVASSSQLQAPTGWRATVVPGVDGNPACRFVARPTAILMSGDSVSGFSFTSTLLPALGPISAMGVSPPEDIPTGEETPDSVLSLVNAIRRRVARVTGIIPMRSPASSTSDLIGYVVADLGNACGALGWVNDEDFCRSLQAKLNAASAALGRKQVGTARNQMSAFRMELEAQRGKHVSESAYWLLRVLADRTLLQLH